MSNIAQALKDEITRISRKELKAATESMRKTTIGLKKTVAELRLKISALEKLNKKLSAALPQTASEPSDDAPESAGRVKVTAKQIRSVRSRLGLSQAAFGQLIGVTGQSVLSMEHKQGKFTLRAGNMSKFLQVKGMKKQDALKALEDAGE